MEPVVSGKNSVEEIYKLIRELPAEKQSELINKILEGSGLVVIMGNGCVTNNTINVGGRYDKLAEQIEAIALELRTLKSVRN
ncbi:hypothetical protein [Microcoleus sp. OTE_8_concoct_300]|uniref:hypothetical protein n=1 Tax=Microcoleus sp. OTE_8_concoct_300 TaxID=2964710 RepID=UPI00403EF8B6